MLLRRFVPRFKTLDGAMEVTLSSRAVVACSDSSNSQLKLSRKPRMSVVSDWVNKSAAGGNGGGEGKIWCKTGSKLNSKSAKGTGGESIVCEENQGRRRVRTRPNDLAVFPDRHRRSWLPKRPSLTTSNPYPTSSSKVNSSNSSLRPLSSSSSRMVKLTRSNQIAPLLVEGKVGFFSCLPSGLEAHLVRAEGPSVRRACATCHAGKTRCSEVLPCQVRNRPPSALHPNPQR
jgi:hypothetical protein